MMRFSDEGYGEDSDALMKFLNVYNKGHVQCLLYLKLNFVL